MFKIDVQKIPGFFLVGLLSTTVHYAILFALFSALNVELVLASSFGALSGALVNYYLNYYYTFNSSRQHVQALGIFTLVVSIGLLLNGIIVGFVFHYFQVPALFAQLSATLITFFWNYLAHQRWTF